MICLIVLSLVFQCIAAIDVTKLCKCEGVEVVCRTHDGPAKFKIPRCSKPAQLARSVGPGFIVSIECEAPQNYRTVVIHRTTLNCSVVQNIFKSADVTLNHRRCRSATTGATVNMTLPTVGPRPPAIPVDDGENRPDDDDDDDGNRPDDDGDDSNDDTSYTSSDSEYDEIENDDTTSTNTPTTSVGADGPPILVIRGHVHAIRLGLILSFTVVIGAGVVIIVIRMRMRRRGRHDQLPIQLEEVSSTSAEEMHSDSAQRSPRRRRSLSVSSSMESVRLYPVSEHQD